MARHYTGGAAAGHRLKLVLRPARSNLSQAGSTSGESDARTTRLTWEIARSADHGESYAMKISFAEPTQPKSGTLVVGVFEDAVPTAEAAELDTATGGAVTRALQASRFTGTRAQPLAVLSPANLSV